MWTLIYVGLALVINFYSPDIPENHKSIKNNYAKNTIIKGFPYQYFEGEVLTDEMVEFRLKRIYMYYLISMTAIFHFGPLAPTVRQVTFINQQHHL